MDRVSCFKIQLFATECGNLVDFSKMRKIHEVSCSRSSFEFNPLIMAADPYLFVKDDILYLFYEAKYGHNPGIIEMIHTCDLKTWSEPVVVLKENHHLSYPWVFEEKGHIYMMPESKQADCIKLYECTKGDLTEFKYKTTLLKGRYVDSSIYRDGKNYFLMTSEKIDGIYNLLLFVADNLTGKYLPHPMSPLMKNNKFGRNGGCFIKDNGKIYRFAQDCTNNYGENIHVIEITSIDKENYKEKVVKESVFDRNDETFKGGGHQYNFVDFKGKRIVATDAKESNYLFFYRLSNFKRKLLK